MNGAFIDLDETFPITIKIRLMVDDAGNCTGVNILPPDAEGEDVQTIVCDVTGRDTQRWSEIAEVASVINHYSKKPMFRRKILFRQIILTFFKSWNLSDDNINIAVINPVMVGRLHDSICKALAWKWLKVTGGTVRPDSCVVLSASEVAQANIELKS